MTTYLQSVRPHIGSQLYLPIVKENAIDRIDIINAMLDAVDDDQIRFVAGRQSKSCAPKEIYRLIQAKFQCNAMASARAVFFCGWYLSLHRILEKSFRSMFAFL